MVWGVCMGLHQFILVLCSLQVVLFICSLTPLQCFLAIHVLVMYSCIMYGMTVTVYFPIS